MTTRYAAADLTTFAISILEKAGLEQAMARAVAETLVEGDLLGHSTHGLALLPAYLGELEKGSMARAGQPKVLADYPAAVTWDGMRLAGPWLVLRAIDVATERAKKLGTCTVVIRRSHHIGCLAAYLKRVTDQGLMIILTNSDPGQGTVAPHGGLKPLYTPDPIAAAWPTDGDPVILDISMSITTNGMTKRLTEEKRNLPGAWLIDGQGNPSNDPAVLSGSSHGALLPIGGIDHGHKGYAMALLVEALTSGLSGFGRADPKQGWGANVFLQVMDPKLFGGGDEFVRQTSWLAKACKDNSPRPGIDRVRLPGEQGLQRRSAQLRDGVELYPSIMPALQKWGQKLDVAIPRPLSAKTQGI